jgi:uncharacterized protein YlbG (UPF0298 family)
MARTKIEKPLVLTEQEEQKIRESVKLKRKTNLVKSIQISFNQLIVDSKEADCTIDKIKEYINMMAQNAGVAQNLVKLKIVKNSYHSSPYIIFYVNTEETLEEFNKRVNISIAKKIITANNNKLRKIAEEEKEKQKKKALLIKAIEELGPEIYDIFDEIKLRSPNGTRTSDKAGKR